METAERFVPIANELGCFLAHLRTTRGWSLTQAAQVAGISRSTLHRWEQGRHLPRLPELDAVLTALEADHRQRRQAIALVDAPRAQARVREPIRRFGKLSGLGPPPNGGDLLRAMRLRRGLSLAEVAAYLGISTRTLRFWEKAEVWPPVAQIHSLCHFLAAKEEEIVALTSGSLAVTPTKRPTLESLVQRLASLGNGLDYPISRDLEFLLLEIDAWHLAMKQAHGRDTLARVYACHAEYLTAMGLFREAAKLADRALELLPGKSPRETFWLHAGIASARAAVFRGARPVPQRGIELLRTWLPVAPSLEYRAWILSDMAKYLAMEGGAGNIGEAVRLSDQACLMAIQSNHRPDVERYYRDLDKARILLLAGRPAETLDMISLPTLNFGPGYHLTDVVLLQAEAFLAIGDRSHGWERLEFARNLIEGDEFLYLRPRAEALALQFERK